jgi:hypothetical protein
MVEDLGFRGWGLCFGIWGLGGFRARHFGFGVLGFMVGGSG